MTDENCTICLENIDDEFRHTLPCGHEFHWDCVISAYNTQRDKLKFDGGTCPLCRRPYNIDAWDTIYKLVNPCMISYRMLYNDESEWNHKLDYIMLITKQIKRIIDCKIILYIDKKLFSIDYGNVIIWCDI